MRAAFRIGAVAIAITSFAALNVGAQDISSIWEQSTGHNRYTHPGPTSHAVVNPGNQMTQEEYFAWFRAKYPGIHYQALCHGVPSVPGDPCPASVSSFSLPS